MCGIVGLLVKNQKMRADIGKLMLPMLIGMTERGPDSAGLAIFGAPVSNADRKFSLYAADEDFNWQKLGHDFTNHLGTPARIEQKANHAVLTTHLEPSTVRVWLKEHYPSLHLLSVGQLMDIYKDTGTPAEVAERYSFQNLQGSHLVGHTRMATESAVTPAHAHPFTAGEDWCLVHNGSLSNPNSIRRMLQHQGISFETDNDTEAACRFLEWRMREGDDLRTALNKGFDELDGFFTLLMGTKDQLALVRDPFACKPAIVAEHDDYVAIASEYRSLAHLPDVKNANLYEPMPEELYIWKV
ncbi:amidophosphoribosyltransferase [Novimethylophilus kurashikiensis]|uniref:Amidophosphoribosyltransferase n=1 Tax=Novimethylophilus kurashikiensis TaxID=1825523 RepID=A0A2R5F9Z9_9PROT|nr:glutamine amidotransferase family protein [Novimethylophilus kurashikiensis]GBG13464.1 amidophosphoribosyltransferase [Novimethylophilus kurashikiensis]